jgi:phosphonate transport system substrate-binding protein
MSKPPGCVRRPVCRDRYGYGAGNNREKEFWLDPDLFEILGAVANENDCGNPEGHIMGLYAKSRDINIWGVWLGMLLSLFMAACSRDDGARTVKTLRVAVLPDQSEAQLRSKYLPLLEHMKSHTGLHYELLIPESYEQLLQWFNDKQIDIARFGGATYVKAYLQSKAIPLVMRDVDGHFRSAALMRVDNPANSLQDLEGASFAFGDRLSTSGHFMPRYFFQQKNIVPETFFSKVRYSGAHDRTVEWVRDGKVESGVVNFNILNEMYLDGRLGKGKVKVVWTSPPYANYVWAIQRDISEQQRALIRYAFISLSHDDENKLILQKLGASYYIPSVHDDFSGLEQVILTLEQRDVMQ